MHKPQKQLGQHFLQDAQVIADIVAAAAIGKQDHVVEIGPGLGALTTLIAERARRLDLIEFDRNLADTLRRQFAHDAHVHVHQADALTFDFAQLVTDQQPLRVMGNLPYNISTPLLFHVLDYQPLIQDMLFMLQQEVVLRLVATPGHKAYGRLTVMARYHCQAAMLFHVPPSAFFPVPRVDSAVVHLVPHRSALAPTTCPVALNDIVTLAFNQRRKTLGNSLKTRFTRQQLLALQIDPNLRAEQLSLDDFIVLSGNIADVAADATE
jgi:16S rRNA (adenine1518-N6/adenine1519-N6)-dimethyltransferase